MIKYKLKIEKHPQILKRTQINKFLIQGTHSPQTSYLNTMPWLKKSCENINTNEISARKYEELGPYIHVADVLPKLITLYEQWKKVC